VIVAIFRTRQGSVATRLKCNGTLMMRSLQIHCWVYWWKNFENLAVFGKVMVESRVSFFDSWGI